VVCPTLSDDGIRGDSLQDIPHSFAEILLCCLDSSHHPDEQQSARFGRKIVLLYTKRRRRPGSFSSVVESLSNAASDRSLTAWHLVDFFVVLAPFRGLAWLDRRGQSPFAGEVRIAPLNEDSLLSSAFIFPT
jgi:hypothetical protein